MITVQTDETTTAVFTPPDARHRRVRPPSFDLMSGRRHDYYISYIVFYIIDAPKMSTKLV